MGKRERERERELVALLSLSSWCVAITLGAMSLSAVCDCDIARSYSLYLGCHSCEHWWLWRVCTFAWSSLSLRHSSNGGSNGDWMPFCVSSEGSGESAHLHRLILAFVTVQNLLCCLKWRFVWYLRQQRILGWVCTFAQAKSLDNAMSIIISCAVGDGSWESARLHRLAWTFVTVSNIMCWLKWRFFLTFMWTANAVVCLHQQSQHFCATISALYQCFKNTLCVL